MHQNRGHGSTPLVELCFDHESAGFTIRIGLEVENFRLQQDGFQQLVEIGALECGHFNIERVATHTFDDDLLLQ